METKNLIFRRISAYIADFLLVSFVVALFSEIYIINPYYEEYIDLSNEYLEYVESIGLNDSNLDMEKLNKYTYDLSYYSVYISIITLVVNILYFVVFQYFNNGRTIGKAIFKIRIKNNKNKKLKIYHLLFRYCILLSFITSIISIVAIFILSMNMCINVMAFVQTIDDTLMLSCILMMILRNDNRGLHDLIAGTCVISEKKELIKE